MERNEFLRFGTIMLKSNGFRRKGHRWLKELEECILCMEFQKNPWGDSYYINLLVRIKEPSLGPPDRWDVYKRIGEKDSEGIYSLVSLLDLSDGISVTERLEGLRKLTERMIVPWFESVSSIRKIKSCVQEGKIGPAEIWSLSAREYFGVSL